jgi:hypothetical protein
LHWRDPIQKSPSDVATVNCKTLKEFVSGGIEEMEKTHNMIGRVLGA